MVLNETNPIESAQRQENIKAMITAKTLVLEEKYKTPVKCSSFVRFIFFSNREFAFPIESGSRRPNIIKSSGKYLPDNYGIKESAKHFTKLAKKFYNKDFQYAVLRYLLKRDISKFKPRVFEKSELHKSLEELSVHPLINFMAERIVKPSIERKEKMYSRCSTSFLKEYQEYLPSSFKFDVTPKKFIAEMKRLFNATTKKSSVTHILVDIEYTRKLLTDKYNFNFNVDEDSFSKSFNIKETKKEKNDEVDIKKYEFQISEKDKEIERLKKIIEDLQKKTTEDKPKKEEKKEKEVKKEKKIKYSDIEEKMMQRIEEMEESDIEDIEDIEENNKDFDDFKPQIKTKSNKKIKIEKKKSKTKVSDEGLLSKEEIEKQKVNMKGAKEFIDTIDLFDDL